VSQFYFFSKIDRETNKQTDRETNKQTDRQTDNDQLAVQRYRENNAVYDRTPD